LWIFVTLASLLIDMLILQPARIWLKWVALNSTVSSDMRQICDALAKRFISIIQRKAGVMRDANSLIQHFNPACRAARQFPRLAVSRFLLSMNDYDLPFFSTRSAPLSQKRGLEWYIAFFFAIVSSALAVLTWLALPLQDAVLELLATVVFNVAAYILYQIGLASAVVAVLIFLALIGGVFVREWWIRLLARRKIRQREAKQAEDGKLNDLLAHNKPAPDGSDHGSSPGKKDKKGTQKKGAAASVASSSLAESTSSPEKDNQKQHATAETTTTSMFTAPAKTKDSYLVDDYEGEIDRSPMFKSKFKPTASEIVKRLVPSRSSASVSPGGALGEGGEGGEGDTAHEHRTTKAGVILPSLKKYGGGGLFGATRPFNSQPLQLADDASISSSGGAALVAETIANMEKNITLNLETVRLLVLCICVCVSCVHTHYSLFYFDVHTFANTHTHSRNCKPTIRVYTHIHTDNSRQLGEEQGA